MAINGSFKIFEPSRALIKNGDTVSASSGSVSEDNLIDGNKFTKYESIGSDDSTPVTLTITFSEPKTISRLFLLRHNFKSYTITPILDNNILDSDGFDVLDSDGNAIEDSGDIVQFNNVISLFNKTVALNNTIVETDYSIASSYYEFNPTYCLGFLITVTEAQESVDNSVDQEKFCFQCIPTFEVNDNSGSFIEFPKLRGQNDLIPISSKTVNRLNNINKLLPVFSANVELRTTEQNDVSIVQHLKDRSDPFLFWANGGNFTEDESEIFDFRFNSKPYRLQDVYLCQTDSGDLTQYFNDIYSNMVTIPFNLKEVNQ